jgi:tetratricopeptide (TPR) repeat protein
MLEWIKSKLGLGDSADRLLREAEALRAEGKAREARACCDEVLRSRPGDARACCLMANLAADVRNTAEGLGWARRAAAADPRSAEAHYVAGRLLEGEGRLPEAEASYRAALALAPRDARTHNNLGAVLHMQGRLDAALASYRRALELDPDQPQARQNYASLVRDSGALEQAIEGYQRQIAANPRDTAAHTNLANTYRELGRYAEALAAFQRALDVDPDDAEAHFSRSFVLLLMGDYREGWKEYEWRLRASADNAPLRRFPPPVWDGSPVGAGNLLLHAEQGFGDTLQFARYVALAAERCPSVVLLCQPELRALLRPLQGAARVVGEGELVPDYAAHAPLMSLPRIFGTTLDTVPWHGPYVRPDPQRVAAWRPEIGAAPARPRIGIAWAGRAEQWDDRKRSIALALLAPLAGATDAEFYSLQKGEASTQAANPPAGMRLHDLTTRIRDFSDTAALIANLDLVISVDSAVAHLAGAMGVPTWVLVAHAPDWRYHLERSDNPWYPTMRLFRQDRDGDWSGPVARAAQALRERFAQKQGG